MNIYTLLYIDDGKKNAAENNKTGNFARQIKTYVACVVNLQKSLAQYGNSLTLLTNNKSLLVDKLNGYSLDVIEIPFSLKVPDDIKFYAAHFKFDIYKYFSELKDGYYLLIDNDVFCLNPAPSNLNHCIEHNIPVYYDVTNQMYPALGKERIIDDMKLIDRNMGIGIWTGGELIGGDPSFYRDLYQLVISLYDRYLDCYRQLHKQGSEVLSSIAIEKLLVEKKYYIADVGAYDGIVRYWSVLTKHKQKQFDAYLDSFLLHLPADKGFLSSLQDSDIKKKNFINKYQRYRKLNYAKSVLVDIAKSVVKR